ncbi:hypothetical protein BOTBODRAFT_126914 [Botryobasidium botryosum FD-172 SS1]|uniref:PPIase cyclophilin-type domain-containing protein n=1 Tax=Botryobasidium botryosum (strain FD-172 SS1) TaxID=930990 RepID=A0A067MWH0_BOTB1|nr:hypothetical protein BOTBODRAFT_126914 [Botryobasidium botryosum FD-172 SS1]
MALPTNGSVVLETTVGEIEIELWSKEAPKACRNFLALAMEGYYDGVIFHRVVPGFLIQTGDRTGTGGGGESFYGDYFPDEIHPRLRFSHRGLVAAANNGTKDSNDSQFIITLDRADELHGKQTLFGRCVGDTFFNALKIGQMEINEDGRPLYPPKIKSVRIVENPFDDIVPRITAEEKRAQALAKLQAQKEREEAERMKGAKKNVGLLSFGDDEEAVDEGPSTFKKKPITRPDLIDDPSLLPPIPTITQQPEPPKPKERLKNTQHEEKAEKVSTKSSSKTSGIDISSIREKHAQEQASGETQRRAEIEKMEAEIRKIDRRRLGEDDDDERAPKKHKGPSVLEQELAKYSKNKSAGKKGKKDESDVLAALSSFRGKLQKSFDLPASSRPDDAPEDGAGGDDDTAELEIDDDRDWLNHKLYFPKDETESSKAHRGL